MLIDLSHLYCAPTMCWDHKDEKREGKGEARREEEELGSLGAQNNYILEEMGLKKR